LACLTSMLSLPVGSAWPQEDPRGPEWPVGPFYKTGFGEPEVIGDWTIASGVWQLRDGVMQQTAVAASRIATVTAYRFGQYPDMGHNYTFDTYASIRSTAANARAGVVFDFADAANYHEATFSATGNVQLKTRRNGVTTTAATATFRPPGVNRWTHIRIERGHGTTIVKMDGVAVIRALQQDLAPGDIGLIADQTVARFEDVAAYTLSLLPHPGATYVEDFNDSFADFWSIERGTWNAAPRYYQSTAVGIADIAVTDIPQLLEHERDITYTLKVRMLNRYGARGNLMGLILDYIDSANYGEILFSPTGQAYINAVEQGVRRTLAITSYEGGGPNRWFEVELVQQLIYAGPDNSYVKVNGHVVFNNIPFAGIFRGFVTHWTQGRFDDVRLSTQVFNSSFEPFDESNAQPDGWRLQDGTLNGFVIQASNNFTLPRSWHEMHDVSFRAWIQNHYGSSGNRAGLMYGGRDNDNYFDWDNYHEVAFSPTGVAYLNRVLHGQVMNIATAPYAGGGPHRWFNVQIIRRAGYTTVRVNGATIFAEVYQPDASGDYVGVVTHWTNASFDDLSIAEISQ
ncbi:MAG: hypothetical protein ABW110_12185, partial [Steroidobacteraceae bacterium]